MATVLHLYDFFLAITLQLVELVVKLYYIVGAFQTWATFNFCSKKNTYFQHKLAFELFWCSIAVWPSGMLAGTRLRGLRWWEEWFTTKKRKKKTVFHICLFIPLTNHSLSQAHLGCCGARSYLDQAWLITQQANAWIKLSIKCLIGPLLSPICRCRIAQL